MTNKKNDDILVGRRLANFQIERPLGRGGMAQVYYGQDIKLRRPVAIKVIDARYRDRPAYAERFVREAQAIATWRHENIIQIYYADDEDGFYYYVMEFVDGPDLGQLLSRYKEKGELIPPDELLRMGRAMASALDYAHQKGIIHRDLKPSNVMVDQDGRVVLTDFGLAMDVEQGSMGEVFGSAHYVAPEQARHSANAVPQSDVYSLGIVLYEMLTGQVPFDDPSSTAVALQHLTSPVPPPREINPNLSAEVEAVLLKALSKAPEDRYQSGKALMDALETVLQPQKAQAHPPPTGSTHPHIASTTKAAASSPVPAEKDNRPIIYAAGAGVVVLIFILLGFMFLGSDSDDGTALNSTSEAEVIAGTDELINNDDTESEPTGKAIVLKPSSTPTSTPPPSPTPTATPEAELLADTQTDFAEAGDNWSYLWSPPGADDWASLSFENRQYGSCWYGQDYIRICSESGHPGNGADIAWVWQSDDISGTLEIRLAASKIDVGGDGVTISLFHNTRNTSDFPEFREALSGTNTAGFFEKLTLEQFEPGDELMFVMQRNGHATSDHTTFRAQICLNQCP